MKIFLVTAGCLLGLLLLLILLYFVLTVRFYVSYCSSTGAFSARLRVWFVTVSLYPPAPKKQKKIKKARLRKRRPSSRRKKNPLAVFRRELSGLARAAHIGQAITRRKKETEIPENKLLRRAREIASALRIFAVKLKGFLPDFADSITVTVESLHLTAGSEDAADAAVCYGILCGGVQALYAVSEETEHFHLSDRVSVDVDFLAPRTECEITLRADVRVFKVIKALYGAEAALYKYRR